MGDTKDIIIDIYTEIKNIFVNTTQINIEFASILESVEAERQYCRTTILCGFCSSALVNRLY